MDPIFKEAIEVILRDRFGLESLHEIELLPDEEAELASALFDEIIELAELNVQAPDEVFDAFLAEASPEAQTAWREIIDLIG